MKEPFFQDAFAEYRKRLGPYCRFALSELPEHRLPERPSPAEVAAALDREAAELSGLVPGGAALVALCVEGKPLDSPAFARLLERFALSGKSCVCFAVGGSCGLGEAFKRSADFRLSLSAMTFPHHLARVMLMEQIYRAFTISAGGKYHK